MNMQTIKLSIDEIISLINENEVKREKFIISSNSSFISFMARFHEIMAQRVLDDK